MCVHRRLAQQPIYLHAEEERWTGGRSSPVVLVIILQVTKDTQVKLLMNIYISLTIQQFSKKQIKQLLLSD